MDICVDFTIYGLIPVGVTSGTPSYAGTVMMGILLTTFFVNAAGLFLLSALIEKNQNAKKNYKSQTKKEVTSVKMPPALVEGFESTVLFMLIIWFPKY